MRRRFFWLLLVPVLAVGCGSEKDPSRVTGKVTLNGETLPGAYVEFYPTGGSGNLAYGKTNAEGIYEARISDSRGGATVGENLVRISTKEEGDKTDRVPPKYNKKSDLKVMVKEGEQVIDFPLVTDDKPVAPAAAK